LSRKFNTRKEAAAKLRKSVSWLDHSRGDGSGPPFYQIGSTILYDEDDLDRWVDAQKRTRTWEFDKGKAA
jgi:hypothetical protein